MPRFQALEISLAPDAGEVQLAMIERCLEASMDPYGGAIVRRYPGDQGWLLVLGFPDLRLLRAYFAQENWRELSHDFDAAGLRWRRDERVYAAAA